MPNIASLLKAEITRLARKEVRAATEGLKKAVTGYRAEIAALKRRTQALEKELQRLRRARAPAPGPQAAGADEAPAFRFSARSLASQRKRLGLSAEDCGLLLGTSGQSVYNWEAGKVRPRASHMPAIVALRRLGKREAAAVLAERRGTPQA